MAQACAYSWHQCHLTLMDTVNGEYVSDWHSHKLEGRFMDNSPTNQLADNQLADRPTRRQSNSPTNQLS